MSAKAIFSARTILVTGGAGFIGGHLVSYLLQQDSQVRVVTLDKLTYAGTRQNLIETQGNPRHLFVRGDICDRALVEDLLREHAVDAVMHLAAESHVDRSVSAPATFVETNIVGTHTLLEAARIHLAARDRPFRFLHVSTDEVYGSLGPLHDRFTEASTYAPNSPYAASKAASDLLVRASHRTHGLPALISHCSNNYGPRQHAEKFIPTVMRACRDGQPIPIYGDGTNIRDWIYVLDHCRALWLILQGGVPGEVYNAGGDCELANIDLAHAICRAFDARRPARGLHGRFISFVEDRKGHDWRYAVDSRKICQSLGWRAETTFEAGLDRTIDWFLAEEESAFGFGRER